MSESLRSDADLIGAVRAALEAIDHPLRAAPLACLQDKGLAHDHVRLCGTGVLARIPKQSQLNLTAADNLLYQRICFERAQDSHCVPRFFGYLPPSTFLPRGALLVEEIVGRSVDLTQDLGRIVESLAAIHALAIPPESARPPLLDQPDPLQALFDEINEQARYLSAAAISAQVKSTIIFEMARLQDLCTGSVRPARCLIAFDGHPGNYVVRESAPQTFQAVLVDLEKCRYSYPSLDLAHATLYTSTTWDADVNAVLSGQQVCDAYAGWATAVGDAISNAAQGWHLPLRRAMWLWSLTWCAKWRCVSNTSAKLTVDGEDWSAYRSDVRLINHVRNRVDHFLSAEAVGFVLNEFTHLENHLN